MITRAALASIIHRGMSSFSTSPSIDDNVVVIFDFDWSLINENSDTYVFQILRPDLLKTIQDQWKTVDWTTLMDSSVGSLMRSGVTRKELSDCLHGIPFFQETFQSLRLAKDKGAKVFILSDANEYYISEIIGHHSLDHLIDQTITNFSEFETLENGSEVLRIKPYQHPSTPHGCRNCPINLCKGICLESIIKRVGGRESIKKIVYVGDGGGDFCPCLALSPSDFICCRNNWTLHKKIRDSDSLVMAQCIPWSNGADLLHCFEDILNS